MMQLSGLFIHPLKSGRAIACSEAVVTEQGLRGDREWLVVDQHGRFVTARTHPQLLKISATPREGGLDLQVPHQVAYSVSVLALSQPLQTTVWKDVFAAWTGDAQADAYLSAWLGEAVRLVWMGPEGQGARRQKRSTDAGLSFADGYPFLLIGEGSLATLNQVLETPVTMRHFRPNLVISGAEAYAEDHWHRIRIGDVEFESKGHCTRCILTTIDPDRAEPDANREPLMTLTRLRRFKEGVCFGQNLVALNSGRLAVGMPVEVLSVVEAAG